MIEPTMKATPPRKNRRPTTSPAAARFSANPVSEIAFGVSRDSIRRCLAISCAVGRPAPSWLRRRCRGGMGVV